MKQGHTQEQVDRVLRVLVDAMRALTARTTVTYDNQLSVAQKLLARSFEGWDPKDIPANIPLVMRDLAIYHDTLIDSEMARIVDAFELTEKWVKEATGYHDEDKPQQVALLPEQTEPPPPPATFPEPPKRKKTNGKHPNAALRTVVAGIFRDVSVWKEAKTLDELIIECTERGSKADREQVASVLRTLSTEGMVVEVDLPSGMSYLPGIAAECVE